MRTALTIAGSDPGGGAGIQADLKTFAAHQVFGTSAITAITVQNTMGVTRVVAMAADLVAEQIDAVVADFGADATKIGMLVNADIVDAVARALARHRLASVVLDPVMVSKNGIRLLDAGAVALFRDRLLPHCSVITPNAPEAEVLTGLSVRTVDELTAAAIRLVAMGARAVVVTGGHVDDGSGEVVDVLHDGQDMFELRAPRVETRHTHGTGCTFSSAIAARLARGDDLVTAVRIAKAYVTRAIQQAPKLGHGQGPLQHFPQADVP